MIGALITIAFCLMASYALKPIIDRRIKDAYYSETIGLGGLISLGLIGTLTLLFGLIPGALPIGMGVVTGAVVVGFIFAVRAGTLKHPQVPVGLPEWISTILLVVCSVMAVFTVLGPSDALDWDTIAYHLAVPKIWLASGHIHYIEGIHQSNFPFAWDNLYLYGLWWGGEPGAKAFNLLGYFFGASAISGLTIRWAREWGGGEKRNKLSQWAPTVAVALFAGSPLMLWQAGTAYIDLIHGLYCGLAMLYLADAMRKPENATWAMPIGGILLGLGIGTKYTGLAAALAIDLVIVVWAALQFQRVKAVFKPLMIAAGLATVIAAPWYIKNIAYTGNPVFPFAYSVFGGRDWAPWKSEIYTNEQQTFGVGRTESGRDPTAIGHAIFGLAYQPGRFINPGQEFGLGYPYGALGAGVIGALLLACAAGPRDPAMRASLLYVGITLLVWFFLSQQSRYLAIIVPPLCLLGAYVFAGGSRAGIADQGTSAPDSKPQTPKARLTLISALMLGIAGLQMAYTLGMFAFDRVPPRLDVITGHTTEQEFYTSRGVSFAVAAQQINEDASVTGLAMFDEVFGFYLDKPYLWANPGHPIAIDYDALQSGAQLMQEFRSRGLSHVYVKPVGEQDHVARFVASLSGAGSPGSPDSSGQQGSSGSIGAQGQQGFQGLSQQELQDLAANPETVWKPLLIDAIRTGHLGPPQPLPGGLLMEIRNLSS